MVEFYVLKKKDIFLDGRTRAKSLKHYHRSGELDKKSDLIRRLNICAFFSSTGYTESNLGTEI